MKPWQNPSFLELLKLAVLEDLQTGDATSEFLVPDTAESQAVIKAKDACIVCGQDVARTVFHYIDTDICYDILIPDGSQVQSGTEICRVSGSTHSILAAERIALNFMQRMSGIATATSRLVKIVEETGCRVVDTRKTLPGHRLLDKYAVLTGGGHNHRMNLGDGILIKDNHITAAGSVTHAVKSTILNSRHSLKIEVEVKNSAEADEAVLAGADSLLLDNMTPDQVRSISSKYRGKVLLESSGNISKNTIRDYAEAGVDIVSVGALTHSVIAADLSLLFL